VIQLKLLAVPPGGTGNAFTPEFNRQEGAFYTTNTFLERRSYMKRGRSVLCIAWIVLVSAFYLGIFPSSVFAADEADVYGLIESFTWREFKESGAQLLRESGPLFGVGMSFRHVDESKLTVKLRGELFGGKVDYVGQTWGGQPVSTNVNYFGLKGEGDLGRKFMVAEKSSLEPFAGLGLRWWVRDISGSGGYTEAWQTYYFRLGVRGDHDFAKESKWFAEAGVKLPIYNANKAYFSDIGPYPDVTVKPGKKTSMFAETGVKVNRLKVSVFYEGMRFSQSSAVDAGLLGPVVQPESKSDIYGVTVGVVF
jgi:hypothetical protein